LKSQNYYAILGVRHDADEVVIAAAFRALAKKYHPDTRSSKGERNSEQFQLVQTAFETLRDSEKRKEYDEKLASIRSRKSKPETHEKTETKNNKTDTKRKKTESPQADKKTKVKSVHLTLINWKHYAHWAFGVGAFCTIIVVAGYFISIGPVPSTPEVTTGNIYSRQYPKTNSSSKVGIKEGLTNNALVGVFPKVNSALKRDFANTISEHGKSCKLFYERIVGDNEVMRSNVSKGELCLEKLRADSDYYGRQLPYVNSSGKGSAN
jgi:DnaJ domain